MKLSYDDKLRIYELRKNGVSCSQLSQQYDIQVSNFKYMVKLIDNIPAFLTVINLSKKSKRIGANVVNDPKYVVNGYFLRNQESFFPIHDIFDTIYDNDHTNASK
ncbi:hypothetical protein BMI76_06215 [Streptococcus sp. 'caviae']|nr:hypothetical protein BMI76_06215 [Streptococcus sp. 'caviae']